MPKQLDYSKMFTRRLDGRYQAKLPTGDKTKPYEYLYDRDPAELYRKVQARENPTPPSFKAVAEKWKDHHWEKISAGTKVCYKPSYERAIEEQAGKLITDVSSSDISAHIKKLADKQMSKKLVSTQRTVYSLIFNYAIVSDEPDIKGWIKVNPADAVKTPRGLRQETREAPEDDIIKIIRDNVDKPFGLFPMFAIHTGFRKAEILPLTWDDVDFKRKMIRCNKAIEFSDREEPLKDPKTEAGFREVPLLADLEAVLKRPKSARGDDLIFCNGEGGQISASDYDRLWLSWCTAVGLTKTVIEKRGMRNGEPYTVKSTRPALGAHQLRHGYATILFEAGVDVYTAKELLGHANIETTMAIYTHLRNKQRNKATDALNQFMKERFSNEESDTEMTPKAPQSAPKEGIR